MRVRRHSQHPPPGLSQQSRNSVRRGVRLAGSCNRGRECASVCSRPSSRIPLNEKLTGRGWAGLALGFAGIVSIAAPGFGPGIAASYWVGIAYITLAAAGVSVGNIGMKLLPARMDALAGMGIQLLLGAVPLALLSAATESWGQVSWSLTFALVLGGLAVFGTSLAFWRWPAASPARMHSPFSCRSPGCPSG